MNTFVKSFVYPFVISLVIFSVLAFAVIPPVIAQVFPDVLDSDASKGDNGNSEASGLNSGIKSEAAGTLSLLLIGTDEIAQTPEETTPENPLADPEGDTVTDTDKDLKDSYSAVAGHLQPAPTKTIEFLTLVSFSSLNERVYITSIPTESYVTVNSVKAGLSDSLYYIENNLLGLDYSFISDFVLSVTGVYVDYYAYIDIDDYSVIADKLAKTEITLTESVTTPQKSFEAGSNRVNSAGLLSLLKYDGYSSPSVKCRLLQSLSKSVLEQITTSGYYINAEKKLAEISDCFTHSNIDYEALTDRLPLFFSYHFYTADEVNVVGELITDNGVQRFLVSYDSTSALFRKH